MSNKPKELVLEALRSGRYEEGYGHLREGDCYCVLGVIFDVYLRAHPGEDRDAEWEKITDPRTGKTVGDNVLPDHVGEWLWPDGVSHTCNPFIAGGRGESRYETTLAQLNDGDGLNHQELADIIEEQL